MKLRGALGGLNLLIEASDTQETLETGLRERQELLSQRVTIELAADADAGALQAAFAAVQAAGGELGRVRGPRQTAAPAPAPTAAAPSPSDVPAAPPPMQRSEAPPTLDSSQTVVVHHGLRAGFRGEYRGSVVVLGDVNPGAELVAGGDIIVLGALRGVVHAGAEGRSDAIVYARPIASAQIRIAGAVARSAEDNMLESMKRMQEKAEAELARLQDGVIQIESYHPQRS
ncbi:septum site-determining protein MinC [Deinococcus sp. KNUC1210]|uniref:septum site-determining protein MinC n=1 Tax=Deinococcus sp. KNUC1210 TaxID=2917691 RepID=UPI001EF12187|nr:septum site-determining protein MinC [Deinococcus sp. KNUC1210]ULH15427.1 septum site-determining protein MinC [Deinococcus sp. KNUC1210]